jgi:hypothetical protein
VLRIPGSVTLSLRSVPVSVSVGNGAQQTFSVPLSLNWNLNPAEVPAFRVVVYFSNPQAALMQRDSTQALPAQQLLSRWGRGDFLPFASDSTVTLFRTAILPGMRRGQKQDLLELKIADNAVPALAEGSYQGVLYLEVRYY